MIADVGGLGELDPTSGVVEIHDSIGELLVLVCNCSFAVQSGGGRYGPVLRADESFEAA